MIKTENKYNIIHIGILIIRPILTLVILGLAYLFFFRTFDIGIPCIFYKLTGYRCPGCGMTHALSEMWNLNWEAAWEYNALSITVLPVICVYMLYRHVREKMYKDDSFRLWEYVLLIAMLAAAVVYGYTRNIV